MRQRKREKTLKEALDFQKEAIETIVEYAQKIEALERENARLKAEIGEQNDIIRFYRGGWNLR